MRHSELPFSDSFRGTDGSGRHELSVTGQEATLTKSSNFLGHSIVSAHYLSIPASDLIAHAAGPDVRPHEGPVVQYSVAIGLEAVRTVP